MSEQMTLGTAQEWGVLRCPCGAKAEYICDCGCLCCGEDPCMYGCGGSVRPIADVDDDHPVRFDNE